MTQIIKKYIEKIIVYTIMAMPFALGIGINLTQPYISSFANEYNQAIIRNADTDNDKKIFPSEELKFKQTLINEISKLPDESRNLENIIAWLKTR